MEDVWTKVMPGNRLVRFTYVDLQKGQAFLTAQIADHPVVYSVIWVKRSTHSTAKALNTTSTMNFSRFQIDSVPFFSSAIDLKRPTWDSKFSEGTRRKQMPTRPGNQTCPPVRAAHTRAVGGDPGVRVHLPV